jgi:hypothetical protein
MNSINFLLESNIDELYNSIKERIYSQINYDIDTKGDKYKGIVNKLLIKISKKDLCVEDLNNMAIETISPFLVSKIQNTPTPNISVPTNTHDMHLPVMNETIENEEYNDFASNLNTIENFESNNSLNNNSLELQPEEPIEDILGEIDENLEDGKTLLEKGSEEFLKSFTDFEGFERYDHSDENILSNLEKNENLDSNLIDTFDNTILDNDMTGMNSVINLEIQNLKEEVKLLTSKLKSENFIDKFQVSDNTITTKTLLILDISKNENYDRSIEIFGPHANHTPQAGVGQGWGIGGTAGANVGNYIETKISNIRDYNIKLNDSLFYPANTEVWLDSFTIHKFQGYPRSSANTTTTEAIKGEDFSNFIVRIRGGKFEHIKKYSNQNNFTDNATIIIQNNIYGETETVGNTTQAAALKNQFTYNFTTQDHYIGTLKEGGIIDSLHIDLLGTFVDTTDTPENGFSTWTYMYPWDVDAQCIIRLNLIPPR